MIIKPKLVDAINTQIQGEFTASLQYIAIAVYFDQESLPDLAGFFYRQAKEEHDHGMKFVRFLLEVGGKPVIPGIPKLPIDFKDAADAVQCALDQELKVTGEINGLISLAVKEGDHITNNFLQWFAKEQVEEVATMTALHQTIEHAGKNMLLVEDFVRRSPKVRGAGASDGDDS